MTILFRRVCWAVLLVTPWFVAWLMLPTKLLNETCQANYEFAHYLDNGEKFNSYGAMISEYRKNGTGFVQYGGKLYANSAPDFMDITTIVNRSMEFTYSITGSIVRTNTQQTSKAISDHSEDLLVKKYVLPGFEKDHVDYFQLLQFSNKDWAAAFFGVPRFYCHKK